MPTVHEIIVWTTSGNGRLIAAALLFILMYAVKLVPWVQENILTTPRRKQLATAFLALVPAVWMLADQTVPWVTTLTTAIEAFLGAMGIHVGINVARGRSVGAVPSGAGSPNPAANGKAP